jgi:hypothetical protein
MAIRIPDLWTLCGPKVKGSTAAYVGCSRISASMS